MALPPPPPPAPDTLPPPSRAAALLHADLVADAASRLASLAHAACVWRARGAGLTVVDAALAVDAHAAASGLWARASAYARYRGALDALDAAAARAVGRGAPVDAECAICLESLAASPRSACDAETGAAAPRPSPTHHHAAVAVTECGHAFHSRCLLEWLTTGCARGGAAAERPRRARAGRVPVPLVPRTAGGGATPAPPQAGRSG